MALKVGAKAPAFKMKDDEGEWVSLKGLAGKTVVLYFYPKDMTSGCTTQACDFQANLAGFRKKGAVVLGVSRDSVERHQKFKAKESLTFPLLVDEDGSVCEAYGVWKEKSMYGRKYMGIERTTFVIGGDGKIAAIFEKVKVPGHVKEVLGKV